MAEDRIQEAAETTAMASATVQPQVLAMAPVTVMVAGLVLVMALRSLGIKMEPVTAKAVVMGEFLYYMTWLVLWVLMIWYHNRTLRVAARGLEDAQSMLRRATTTEEALRKEVRQLETCNKISDHVRQELLKKCNNFQADNMAQDRKISVLETQVKRLKDLL